MTLPGRLSSLLDDRRAVVRVPLRLTIAALAAAATLGAVGALEPIAGIPAS